MKSAVFWHTWEISARDPEQMTRTDEAAFLIKNTKSQNVTKSDYFAISGYFRLFPAIAGYFRLFPAISDYFPSISGYFRLFSSYFRLFSGYFPLYLQNCGMEGLISALAIGPLIYRALLHVHANHDEGTA